VGWLSMKRVLDTTMITATIATPTIMRLLVNRMRGDFRAVSSCSSTMDGLFRGVMPELPIIPCLA
jgi:hypothetical protein